MDLILYKEKFSMYSKLDVHNLPSLPPNEQTLTITFQREELRGDFRFHSHPLCTSITPMTLREHQKSKAHPQCVPLLVKLTILSQEADASILCQPFISLNTLS